MQRTNNKGFNNTRGFNRYLDQNGKKFIKKVQVNTNNFNGRKNRDAMIARNLQNLRQNVQKKQMAQELYYGGGRSPLVKTTSGAFIKQEISSRGSVQQRLGNQPFNRGNKFVSKQKFPNSQPNFNNNNNNNIRRINHVHNQQFVGNVRTDKFIRIQNFQRKQHFQNMNGTIKTKNSAGKIIYLQPVRRPANYTVRVENDRKHHVSKGLNPQLQQEIKLIQNKSVREIIAPMPMQPVQTQSPYQIPVKYGESLARLPIVSTGRTLNERFSLI